MITIIHLPDKMQFIPFGASSEHLAGDKLSTYLANPHGRFTVRIPTRATTRSAGYDLYAAIPINSPATLEIKPHSGIRIPTGIRLVIPKTIQAYAEIKPRSSIGKFGISVQGGVIDPDYEGQIIVMLWNNDDTPYMLDLNEAIAQIIILGYQTVENTILPGGIEIESTRDVIRGQGGFGSTNKN
jgi:dUTP pyrophosphatase